MNDPLSAILIDDEAPARVTLRRMLKLYCPDIEVVGESNDIIQGAKLIKQLQPDLVFLDIRIGDHLGFDLLELLENIPFELIFVTAYSEYALEAFQWNALSYLLKPIVPEQLKEVATRSRQRHLQSQALTRYQNFKQWTGSAQAETLTVTNEDGYHFLQLSELVYLRSDQGVTTFHLTEQRKVITARNIGEYARLLPPLRFYRCHQSYVVNIDWVDKYLFQDGGSIVLRTGQQVPLARGRKEGFIEFIKNK